MVHPRDYSITADCTVYHIRTRNFVYVAATCKPSGALAFPICSLFVIISLDKRYRLYGYHLNKFCENEGFIISLSYTKNDEDTNKAYVERGALGIAKISDFIITIAPVVRTSVVRKVIPSTY
jgi:hypothetical protein